MMPAVPVSDPMVGVAIGLHAVAEHRAGDRALFPRHESAGNADAMSSWRGFISFIMTIRDQLVN